MPYALSQANPRSGFGLKELLGTAYGMPERDVPWSGEECAGSPHVGMDVRLLHVRSQEHLLPGPMLDERKADWFRGVLKQGDAATIRLRRLERSAGSRAPLRSGPDLSD